MVGAVPQYRQIQAALSVEDLNITKLTLLKCFYNHQHMQANLNNSSGQISLLPGVDCFHCLLLEYGINH